MGTGTTFTHQPVMRDEVVAAFATVPAGLVVDATVGGGGHSAALLDAHGHISVLGFDRDPAAVDAARAALARFGSRAEVRHARFDLALEKLMTDAGVMAEAGAIETLSGVLFDLGVSSHQLDEADRGFSYRNEAALDMRMDTTSSRTAADVVNGYTEHALARVIRELGDERFAARIARAVVAARPVTTTTDLAALVTAAIPAATRRRGGHPAKRTFQAIRIEVNGELDVLPGAIDAAIALIAPGGRCAVLSYHSGEDRIVKERFVAAVDGGCTCPPGLPCACGAVRRAKVVRPFGRTPSADELAINRRAESARLRVVEKLAVG